VFFESLNRRLELRDHIASVNSPSDFRNLMNDRQLSVAARFPTNGFF
jgi:hypothetical protein